MAASDVSSLMCICSTSGRFAFLYDSHGFQEERARRFFLPAIGVFGRRYIVHNTEERPLYLQPLLWLSSRYQYFLNNFQSFVGQMTENGLLALNKRALETVLQYKLFEHLSANGGLNPNWNFFTYADKVVRKVGVSHQPEQQDIYKSVTLGDFRIVFLLLGCMYIVCVMYFTLEFL